MMKLTTVLLAGIIPGQESFLYKGETWRWRKTASGLYVVGSDCKGLWGDFTNGTSFARIHKGDLIRALGNEAANQIFRRSVYPAKCFVYVRSTDEIGVITRGELGYRPVNTPIDSLDKQAAVDRLNAALGVSKAHAAAMNAGSIFGWDCPAARHSNYDKDGKPKPEKMKQAAAEVR